jgi:hypothetical protein
MRTLSCVLLVFLSACGSEPAPRAQVEAEHRAPPAQPDPAPPPEPRIALHEWGFIGDIADREPEDRYALAAGPHANAPHANPVERHVHHNGNFGKPVIYLHVAGIDEASLTITVGAPGVTFLEEYPDATGDAELGTRSWSVRARRSDRRSDCLGSELPAAHSPRCRSVSDGFCEAAELADYVAEDASCMWVGETTSRLLFYRADSSAELPLSTRRARGSLAITARSGEAPSEVWLVERGATIDATRTYVLPWPSSGELELAEEGAPEGARETLSGDTLAERFTALVRASGLTQQETQAFLDAWQVDLFGESAWQQARTPVGTPPEGLRPARRALLYVMPSASVDRILPLRAEPAPDEVRRFFLTRVTIEAEPAPRTTRGR